MDCRRSEIWRRQLEPGYKASRDTLDHSKDKFNISAAFKFFYDVIIPGLCSNKSMGIISSIRGGAGTILSPWLVPA